ncbi:ABC transporter ATP-binding protein [Asaia bogorensis]|uniref:ABC transporter ATP-binding protein n=1 Tax=Asaia bogorensis TaxID=91915 RepID=UPI00285F0D3D|nr:ABC transporter ATP-binding protein [Asaia bogorensis]MDR6183690.1 ABC-2 type transport system ATP-binding protein [Asaia bogorensis NBRC 16594]
MTDRLLCTDLEMAYKGRPVFSSVTFALGVGLHGLWGGNGTGKSTLLRGLSGVAKLQKGRVMIAGHDLARQSVAAKSCLAYVPDEGAVYPFMTGRDLMALCAWARKAPNVSPDLIEGFGLTPHLDKRYDALSLGTRRKMLIASAFIGTPQLLLMDEPGNGLDAASRDYLMMLLAETARSACILLSSHDRLFLETLGARIIRMETLGKD